MEAMLSDTSPPKESKELSDLDGREDELSGGFVSSEEEEEEEKEEEGDNGEEAVAAGDVGGENGRDGEMEEIMEQMDRELGATEVGKSFEKMKVSMQASSKVSQQPLKPL